MLAIQSFKLEKGKQIVDESEVLNKDQGKVIREQAVDEQSHGVE